MPYWWIWVRQMTMTNKGQYMVVGSDSYHLIVGRTFPTHPYFSGALGSGQLALFNILKAYSLMDTDVGYCQGLSFVAGMLLMHVSVYNKVVSATYQEWYF